MDKMALLNETIGNGLALLFIHFLTLIQLWLIGPVARSTLFEK